MPTHDKVLTENRIRAFIKCSEFYHRGGTQKDPFGLSVVKGAVERIFVLALKKKLKTPIHDIHSCLIDSLAEINQKENLLESQINKYLSSCMLWLKDFFKILNLETYELIIGPTEPKIILSKTPIRIHLPGVLKSKKNQTLHSVMFSPYANQHSVLNDPSILMRILLLRKFVKKHLQSNRPQVILHIFSYTKSHALEYNSIDSNSITKKHLVMLNSILKSIEDNYHFPVIPCPYSCPYKQECYIES